MWIVAFCWHTEFTIFLRIPSVFLCFASFDRLQSVSIISNQAASHELEQELELELGLELAVGELRAARRASLRVPMRFLRFSVLEFCVLDLC